MATKSRRSSVDSTPPSTAQPQLSPQSQASVENMHGMSKSADGAREIRKRNRRWLSCDSCHRMKVKCDRRQPCGRCVRGDRPDKCIYENVEKPLRKSKASAKTTKTASDDEAAKARIEPGRMFKYANGKVRHGGRTHWIIVAHEFKEIRDFTRGTTSEPTDMDRRLKEVKKFFPPKRLLNYPFCPSREPRFATRENIIATLPDRSTVQSLVNIYFETFEMTHALFHEAKFKATLDSFWEKPESVQPGWIASLFLMLALSYHATHRYAAVTSSPIPSVKVEEYLEGAQAALHLAPFMLKPTLDNLQALCVVAIGKAFDIITLDDSDTLYIFTGFILRYAYTLGMHRDPQYATGMPVAEAQARRKIWTTILFLDLRISIESGYPLLIRPSDYDTLPPRDAFGTLVFSNEPAPAGLTPSAYQHRLAQSSRVVSDIVSVINSPTPDIKYDKVLEYDAKLREILSQFPAVAIAPDQNNSAHLFQRCALSIFIHRVLLALHQPYATDPHAWRDYQTSHYSVLQCSLAILGLQRSIYECSDMAVPVGWLHELYRKDFMIAAVYVCVALRRDRFAGSIDGISKAMERKTAWDTLYGSQEIWQKDCTLSVHCYKIYLGFALLTAVLKAIEADGQGTMDVMREAAEGVIAEVTERLGASAHASVSSASAGAGAGADGLGGALDFMFFDGLSVDRMGFVGQFDSLMPDLGAAWGPESLPFEYMRPVDDAADGMNPAKRPWPPTMWE